MFTALRAEVSNSRWPEEYGSHLARYSRWKKRRNVSQREGERGTVKVTLVDNFGNEPPTLTFSLVLLTLLSLGPRKTRDLIKYRRKRIASRVEVGAEPGLQVGNHGNRLPRWLSGEKIHLPMQETQVPSLGGEDPLEKEMITHSSILAWRIPWTERPGRLQSMETQKSWTRLSN